MKGKGQCQPDTVTRGKEMHKNVEAGGSMEKAGCGRSLELTGRKLRREARRRSRAGGGEPAEDRQEGLHATRRGTVLTRVFERSQSHLWVFSQRKQKH